MSGNGSRRGLTGAGWLFVIVGGVLLLGLLALGGRALFGNNSLHPGSTVVPTHTAQPTLPQTPTPNTDAAWETFLQAIYKCDALPDQGDDLASYPKSLDELKAGIQGLTTDQAWLKWCDESAYGVGRRLADFGPQNLKCNGLTCDVAVAVSSTAGITFFDSWCAHYPDKCQVMAKDEPEKYTQWQANKIWISRAPYFSDQNPYRLIKGTIEFQEGQWIITQMQVDVLPSPPDGATTPQP